MRLHQGATVGPYEVLSTLGAGGMGTVYLARDRRLDRRVALKVLHDDPGGSAWAQLLHEARAASALNHPNICHVYDVGEQDAIPWIAMEYVDGEPLDRSIPPGGLDPDEAVRLAIQIADGLAHAHGRGIVHRDLKTANVVCDRDGRPRILDFGIAGWLPDAIAEHVTRSQTVVEGGAIAGTLPYMAPEVLKGARGNERSDLWALGVVLYEMLAGARPFRGDTPFSLASSILEQPPQPLPPHVPAGIASVVSRLLARNPTDRFRSAAEARAALEALRAATPLPARQAIGTRGAWIAAAAVLAIAFGWFVWMWSAGPTPLSLSDQHLLSVSGRGERSPALSPDGSHVAFVAADPEGVPQIFVRTLTSDTAIQITDGPAASRPRWTPSGEQIVYSAGSAIWRIPQLGGEPTRLIDRGTNPNLSSDGSRIVYERDYQIWTAAADGSDATPVAGVPRKYYSIPSGPAFSPDGKWIAYFRPDKGPNGDFWIVAADSGTPRQLTHDLREGGWPVWTSDGRWIVISSARAGSRTLWQLPVDGGDPVPLTTGAGEDDEPDLSPDGSRIVYSNVRHTWELRVRDLATGSERALLERRTELLFPQFSPDGQRLTFFGRDDFAIAIWVIGADGSGVRRLTGGRELNHQPRWGPEGRDIFFFQAAPEVSFRRISALGGASEAFRNWSWEEKTAPFFDPTGRYIAYTRMPPLDGSSNEPEAVVIQDLETGEERVLGDEPFRMGRWSPDGRELAVWRWRGETSTWRCQVESGACRMLTQGFLPAWSADGARIYVLRGSPARTELWSVTRDGGDVRLETTLGSFRSPDRHFDVSRDGLLAWAPWSPGDHEIWSATIQ
ncbi:MAG TPA: protein kinase [Vicinamibacterales bacterium]